MPVKVSLSLILGSLAFLGFFAWHYQFSASDLLSLSFYQALANPSTRIMRIQPGERKEQVALVAAAALGWNKAEQDQFLSASAAYGTTTLEGKYFPKTYLVSVDADPIAVTDDMLHAFTNATQNIKHAKSTKVVNQETILTVASIIQREAAGPQDMRLISGIIWNRLFTGMKLQMDATLQYAKGSPANWWPQVVPADKDIQSPYNTYLYPDLPPTPISNPSLSAIAAAANPQTTSCLFYIHDKNHQIHCSATYQGQLNNIKRYY